MNCGNIYVLMVSMLVFLAMPEKSDQTACNGTWNGVASSCTISATCMGNDGLSITITGTDFPHAGLSEAYADKDGAYNSNCMFDLSGVNAGDTVSRLFNNTFGSHTCVKDNSTEGTKEGFIETIVTLKYGGQLLESGNDVVANIVCEYSKNNTFEPTEAKVTTSTFSATNVDGTDTVTLQWTATTMKFTSSLDDATSLTSVDVKADIADICVLVKTEDADIVDFSIMSLTFHEKEVSPSKTLDVVVDSCFDAKYAGFFYMSTWASTCGSGGGVAENCPKQRTICFKPFRFSSEDKLVVVAELVRETTAGFNSTCTGNGVVGIGRKRREASDDDEEKSVTITATLKVTSGDDEFLSNTDSGSQTNTCAPSTQASEAVNAYLVTIIVLAALVLALGVLIAYIMVIKNGQKKPMSY